MNLNGGLAQLMEVNTWSRKRWIVWLLPSVSLHEQSLKISWRFGWIWICGIWCIVYNCIIIYYIYLWIDWMMKYLFIPWYLRMFFFFLWQLKHKLANSFGVLDFEFSVSALSQPWLKFKSRLQPISWSLKKWKHTTTNWKKSVWNS